VKCERPLAFWGRITGYTDNETIFLPRSPSPTLRPEQKTAHLFSKELSSIQSVWTIIRFDTTASVGMAA
jgi:hypothetical protein